MGAGRPRWARHLVEIECRFAARHSRLMWVLADVVGLFSIIVGPFSPNVGRRQRIFSANLGPKRRMLSGRAVYVIGPLHLSCPQVVAQESVENFRALLGKENPRTRQLDRRLRPWDRCSQPIGPFHWEVN